MMNIILYKDRKEDVTKLPFIEFQADQFILTKLNNGITSFGT